jgi:ribosomal protein S18
VKKDKRKKRRQCNFCADKVEHIDYKDLFKFFPAALPAIVPTISGS